MIQTLVSEPDYWRERAKAAEARLALAERGMEALQECVDEFAGLGELMKVEWANVPSRVRRHEVLDIARGALAAWREGEPQERCETCVGTGAPWGDEGGDCCLACGGTGRKL